LGQQPSGRKYKKVMNEGSWIEQRHSEKVKMKRKPGHTTFCCSYNTQLDQS